MDDYNIFDDCDNAKNETTGNGETDFVAELLKIEAAVDDVDDSIESTHARLKNFYNTVADFGNKSVALKVEKEELQKKVETALKERDKAYEYAATIEKENIGLKRELELEKKTKKKTAFERVISFLREN